MNNMKTNNEMTWYTDGSDYDPDGDPDGDDPPYGAALPAGVSYLPAHVLDYDTNKLLDGSPTARLIEASLDAEPTGAVLAYYSDGMWHYVRPDDESLIRCQGHDVRTVYCA